MIWGYHYFWKHPYIHVRFSLRLRVQFDWIGYLIVILLIADSARLGHFKQLVCWQVQAQNSLGEDYITMTTRKKQQDCCLPAPVTKKKTRNTSPMSNQTLHEENSCNERKSYMDFFFILKPPQGDLQNPLFRRNVATPPPGPCPRLAHRWDLPL